MNFVLRQGLNFSLSKNYENLQKIYEYTKKKRLIQYELSPMDYLVSNNSDKLSNIVSSSVLDIDLNSKSTTYETNYYLSEECFQEDSIDQNCINDPEIFINSSDNLE